MGTRSGDAGKVKEGRIKSSSFRVSENSSHREVRLPRAHGAGRGGVAVLTQVSVVAGEKLTELFQAGFLPDGHRGRPRSVLV